jgi:hypothetical protein
MATSLLIGGISGGHNNPVSQEIGKPTVTAVRGSICFFSFSFQAMLVTSKLTESKKIRILKESQGHIKSSSEQPDTC